VKEFENRLASEKLQARCIIIIVSLKGKGKGFPYSTPSVGPGADPGVQAVRTQVTVSHPPGGRLPLLSARLAVLPPQPQSITALWPVPSYQVILLGDRGT